MTETDRSRILLLESDDTLAARITELLCRTGAGKQFD